MYLLSILLCRLEFFRANRSPNTGIQTVTEQMGTEKVTIWVFRSWAKLCYSEYKHQGTEYPKNQVFEWQMCAAGQIDVKSNFQDFLQQKAIQ